MRRSCTQLLRATSSLWASQHPPDGVSMEDMRKEAKVKGFGRRDSAEDKMFMNETFATTECVGDNVRVANLPAKQQEETQFDVYQRSTSEFSSLVTPHGVREAGIGGGFGAKKDTRLGFLRPRQTSLQPITGSAALAPKYDENGFPLENNLTREDWKEKRKKFMKSFDGMTMSHNEHFLLADLDFEKDTVLFGNTREEFERNVIKLKKVIVAYTRWERTDNIYHYSTVMLKILTVWVLMESIHQYFELKLLAENFDVFAEVLDEEMKALDDTRRADFDQAMAELQHSKPDFAPIVEAIRKERERVHAVALRENSTHHDKNSVLSLLDSTEHPMDTTGEAAYLRQSEDRVQEGEMAKLQASAVKDARRGWWSAMWSFVVGGRHGAGQNAPLQQDDFTKFSYAASPTSIDSVRFLRRILLPRSEDFTQIVREEMVAYQREKDQRVATPST